MYDVMYLKEKTLESRRLQSSIPHTLDKITRTYNVSALLDLKIVQTNDERLVAEYGMKHLPKLVYFRGEDPILYTGNCEMDAFV